MYSHLPPEMRSEMSATSDARLRAILEAAVDGILSIDQHGLIQTMNPAADRMFGYERGEVSGRNVNMLMPAPYREEHDGYIERYVSTGERRIIGIGREALALRKDGEHVSRLDLRSPRRGSATSGSSSAFSTTSRTSGGSTRRSGR